MREGTRAPGVGVVGALAAVDGDLAQQRHRLVVPVQDQRVVRGHHPVVAPAHVLHARGGIRIRLIWFPASARSNAPVPAQLSHCTCIFQAEATGECELLSALGSVATSSMLSSIVM